MQPGDGVAWISEVASVVAIVDDLVAPRIFAVPEGDESLGERAVEWCRRVGITLDLEQELVLRAMLRTRADGKWSSFESGINAPRQNGKGEILMARELFGMFELEERSSVHSAHEFKTSERHFRRCEVAIKQCPELFAQIKRAPSGRVIGFRYSHGDEAIELRDGRMMEFKTRTRSAMRGFDDVALLVLDEAMILQESSHGAMMPTVRASKAPRGPQIVYAGSAADQQDHDHAVVWARVRERGIAGDDPSLCYAEWSLDYDSPDEVPDEVAGDPVLWAKVNFAIGHGRVPVEHMEREFRSLGRRQFVVELLGVGDWPATKRVEGAVIPLEAWEILADMQSAMRNPVGFAFDVRPDRSSASISVAGRRTDGLLHVELVERQKGTDWVAPRLVELLKRHGASPVFCDSYGSAGSLVHDLEELGVEVESVTAKEHANACGMLFDLVEQKGLRHLGQGELAAAIRSAKKRPVGDAWAWSRSGGADVGPLVSATLALWGFVTKPPPKAPPRAVDLSAV